MKMLQQIPRNALAWMLLCLFTLVAPHALRLPLWVLVVYVIAAVWRIMVYRGRWSVPGRTVKFLLILSACGGVALSYGSMVGLEPTVALLLTAGSAEPASAAEIAPLLPDMTPDPWIWAQLATLPLLFALIATGAAWLACMVALRRAEG